MPQPSERRRLVTRIRLGLVLAVLGAGAVGLGAEQQTAVPRDRPTYDEVFEFCLAGYAGTGLGRSAGLVSIVLLCRGQAEAASGGPQPTPSPWTAQYQQCLLQYAVNGAPRGADLAIYCSLATAMTGDQPPSKRYVIFQKPTTNPQAKPSYADAYRRCLVMLAESGLGRQAGLEDIVRSCNETAAQQSGTPKPDETPFDAIFDQCLLSFAQFGAPQGLDLGKACTEVATGATSTPPPVTTRQPR